MNNESEITMLQNVTPDYMFQEEKLPCPKRMEANLVSEHVGLRLRSMRKARSLSIRSLAQISGLSVNPLA